MTLYNRQVPVEEAIHDPRTPEHIRERLIWIGEIKKTTEEFLGVKATANYSHYVDLKRPYVVWAMTVADPFELKLKEWSFPVVGSFPYLGFFEEKRALDEAASYKTQGFDVYVRGVSAYSTLGYLSDPILSSMLNDGKSDLVNLIFHETMHSHVYVKNQGAFNEQIASYVGDYGERLWLERKYGVDSKEIRGWEVEREDRRKLGLLLREFAKELGEHYKQTEGLPFEERQKLKDKQFEKFQRRLVTEKWKGLWKGKGAEGFAKKLQSNAFLLAVLTYDDSQEIYDSLHEKCGRDLKRSVSYLKALSTAPHVQNEEANPQKILSERVADADFSC